MKKLDFGVGLFLIISALFSVVCPLSAQIFFDFMSEAEHAQWLNDAGEQLPFPGRDNDARGFVLIVSCKLARFQGTHQVIETHPRWSLNGTIEGQYRLTIPAESEFNSTVGFKEGASGTDGVRFEVVWSHNGRIEVLDQRAIPYGPPGKMIIDLSMISGQVGVMILRVLSAGSSERDWAVWLNPTIRKKREHPVVQAQPKPDSDEDGIYDAKENELLTMYRPYLRYTQNENYRPCDAIWYVKKSQVVPVADEGETPVLEQTVLSIDPLKILTMNKPGSDWGPSSILNNPNRTRYCINPLGDGPRQGSHGWPAIFNIGNVGIYGHVVPWRGYYLISYWLFYGYSDTEGWQDIGDHEGDWESVHLALDPATGWIVKTVHCAHGTEMIFDFTVQGISRYNIRLDTGQDIVECRGPNYDISDINVKSDPQRACNNLVRFAKDPQTGEFTHIMVYVERGCHGSWPSEYWKYFRTILSRDYYAPPHTGNSNVFLSKTPPNLGEVENPLSNDARIILQYNGRWGAYRGHAADAAGTDSPPGPALHGQWVWPAGSTLHRNILDSTIVENGSVFFTR